MAVARSSGSGKKKSVGEKKVKYVLTLYVTDHTEGSSEAIRNLKKILSERKLPFSLKIIDVIKSPSLAEKAQVLATPLLVRSLPPPIKRVIGVLREKENILVGMDLTRLD